MEESMSLTLTPIGWVRSPYKERFGTPRQATVANEEVVEARISLDPRRIPREALRDLDGFERIWVLGWFHLNPGWRPTVVPTRGPKVRRGVFATRSPHRPCPLALSALELVRVEGHDVVVRGIDLLDGTPVFDIKPYLPYADAFPDSRAGWVDAIGEAADGPDRETRAPPRRRTLTSGVT